MKKILMIFAVVVFVLQGCSTASNSSGDKKGKAAETDKVTILTMSDATSLDPHFITDIPSGDIIHGKVYETLIAFDKNREFTPLLAKEWKQVDDKTWTFELNEKIKFHDGTDFNADAVKATFDRLLDPKTASPQKDKLGMIKEVVVENPTKVTFKLKEPYAGLLAILASNEGSILNPTILKDSPDQLKTKPNGTGPFAFEKWDTGQEIDLVRNEDYWGDKPAFKQLIYKVVPEDATRVAMIENNEAQIAEQVPVTELDRVSNSDKMSLFRADGLAVEYLGFNVQNETLSNVKVRQAISHAIDREAIISGVYNGVGTLANSAMSPEVIGYSKNTKPFSYDIDQAKALLKEANLPKDQKITLTTSDRKERINMAEVIQSQLKGIGLTVEIKVLEYGAYIEEINKKQHQLFIGGWGNATGDGDYNQYNLFHTNSQGAPGNHFYYSNKKVDKLIEAARAESDIEKRKSYYEEAMKIELEEDTAYVPIRNYENLAIYSKNVEGFWLDATNQTKVKDIVIK